LSDTEYTHAGGVVIRLLDGSRRFLIVQSSKDPNHWVLPKGHIKPGESPQEAALREVREEAGVEAEILAEAGTTHFVRGEESIRVLYFAMRCRSEDVESPEGRDMRWLAYKDAIAGLSFEDSKAILRRAAEISRQHPAEEAV
jgi:bis(5'-nucleosidyl)-tetraphosphatase